MERVDITKDLFYQAILRFVLGVVVIGICCCLPRTEDVGLSEKSESFFDKSNFWDIKKFIMEPRIAKGKRT